MTELRKIYVYDSVSGRAIEVDPITDALCTVSSTHHEVHEGDAYICQAVDTGMALNDTLSIAFKTSTTAKRVHMIVGYVAKAAGHLELLQSPTWDASSGALAPIRQRARFSANTSLLEEDQSTGAFIANDNLISNPTTLAGGTALLTNYTFADKKVGSQSRDIDEFVLVGSKQYAVRFTADIGTNAAQIILNWYEHTDAA